MSTSNSKAQKGKKNTCRQTFIPMEQKNNLLVTASTSEQPKRIFRVSFGGFVTVVKFHILLKVFMCFWIGRKKSIFLFINMFT